MVQNIEFLFRDQWKNNWGQDKKWVTEKQHAEILYLSEDLCLFFIHYLHVHKNNIFWRWYLKALNGIGNPKGKRAWIFRLVLGSQVTTEGSCYCGFLCANCSQGFTCQVHWKWISIRTKLSFCKSLFSLTGTFQEPYLFLVLIYSSFTKVNLELNKQLGCWQYFTKWRK